MAKIVINGDVYINGGGDEFENVDESFQDTRISTVTDEDLEMLVDWLNMGVPTMGYTEAEILDELRAREW